MQMRKFVRWNTVANGNVAKARQKEVEILPTTDRLEEIAKRLYALDLDATAQWIESLENQAAVAEKRCARLNHALESINDMPPHRKLHLAQDIARCALIADQSARDSHET